MASIPAYSPYPVNSALARMPRQASNWPQPTTGLTSTYSQATMAKEPLSAHTEAGQIVQTPLDSFIIDRALTLVGQIRNLPQDEAYIRSLGVNPVFQNGQQARRVIDSKGIRVEFGDMGDSPAHAQWIADQNLIMINRQYRGDCSPTTLCAIAEAIYHEAGHAAKLVNVPGSAGTVFNQSLTGNNPADVGDDLSSIQEELDCLALNTLAHRYHEAIYPQYAQNVSSSRLLSDGVALYAKLFFDPDPEKKALVKRVAEKYGDLAMESPGHPIPVLANTIPLAQRVAQYVRQTNPQNQPLPLRQSPFPASSTIPMAFNTPVYPFQQSLSGGSNLPFPVQTSPLQATPSPIPARFSYWA